MIPAQLVFVPYKYAQGESIIRLPISTGAALGPSISIALIRGICEVIERDSFMIYYLNKLTPDEIDWEKSLPRLKKIKDYFNRYKLELKLYDITSDLGVPVLMAIIIDKTGIGPYISIGLKCSFSKETAAIGSIEEAQHTRGWMRDEKEIVPKKKYNEISKNYKKISDTKERGLFWYSRKYHEKIDFWLSKRSKNKFIIKREGLDSEDTLRKMEGIFKEKGMDLYYVDITKTDVSQLGFSVVKVIIPNLQPLFLDEEYPYYGCMRIYDVPPKLGYRVRNTERKLNKFPHPFL